MQHAAQRHRETLDDYRRDFIRTRVSWARPALHTRNPNGNPKLRV